MTKVVEDLPMSLLDIHVFCGASVKARCPLKQIGLFVLLSLSFKCYLCILNANLLLAMWLQLLFSSWLQLVFSFSVECLLQSKSVWLQWNPNWKTFSMFLLIHCLPVVPVTDQEILKSPTVIVDLSNFFSAQGDFVSCILKFHF